MNKSVQPIPIICLIISILFLALAVITLFTGSAKSKIYNQMRETEIIDNYTDLMNAGRTPFLLYGYVDIDHKIIHKTMVATEKECPELDISLGEKSIKLFKGYKLADTNKDLEENSQLIQGIKPGGDITIYAVNYEDDDFIGIKGYELYPGNPKQYIEYLKSPYNSYMLYVRLFIGVALLFFLVSIVLNIKK